MIKSNNNQETVVEREKKRGRWVFVTLLLFVLLYLLLSLAPLPGNIRKRLDQFTFELAEQLLFVPTYIFPLPVREYKYFDENFNRNLNVGYGFVSSFTTRVVSPNEDKGQRLFDIEVEKKIVLRRRATSEQISFDVEDSLVVSYLYYRLDIFLKSWEQRRGGQVLEIGKSFVGGMPVFMSFDWDDLDFAVGDFVRYFYDENGKLVRIDLIDIRV